MRADQTLAFHTVFPYGVIEGFDHSGTRDRIFSQENTILTMVVTATHEDKSLQNSVNIFRKIHEDQSERILKDARLAVEKERLEDMQNEQARRGPRKKYKLKVAKSSVSEVSSNTAAFSKARARIKFELLREVFLKTRENNTEQRLWHGMKTYITDGTYVQMQDTPELRETYVVRCNDAPTPEAYPKGLVQAIIEQGSGLIYDYALSNRHVSELSLIYPLAESIPKGSLLLADDLYNCYAIFALVRKHGFDLIVPGKRDRNYTVVKEIAKGDEIVEIRETRHPKWLSKEVELPEKLALRRISFGSPETAETIVIYTTLLNPDIPASDIILKYFTRWDIEITIREIKTIMDINILRGKTDDIIRKELIAALIAYNLTRKLILQSTQETAFSPKTDIIQEFFEADKDILMDTKGRVYNRWSTGRYGKAQI